MRDREQYSESQRLVDKVDNIQILIKNDPSIYDKIPDLCSGSDIAEHKLSDGTLVDYALTELSGDAAGISFNPEDPMNNNEWIQILTSDNSVEQDEGHIIYWPSLSKVLVRWNVDTEDELFEKLAKYLDELEGEIMKVTNLSKRRFSNGRFNRVRLSKKSFSDDYTFENALYDWKFYSDNLAEDFKDTNNHIGYYKLLTINRLLQEQLSDDVKSKFADKIKNLVEYFENGGIKCKDELDSIQHLLIDYYNIDHDFDQLAKSELFDQMKQEWGDRGHDYVDYSKKKFSKLSRIHYKNFSAEDQIKSKYPDVSEYVLAKENEYGIKYLFEIFFNNSGFRNYDWKWVNNLREATPFRSESAVKDWIEYYNNKEHITEPATESDKLYIVELRSSIESINRL